VFIATPLCKAASVGMLMPLLVGAISWDCHAGEVKEAKKVRLLLGSLRVGESEVKDSTVRMTNCVGKKGSSGLKFLLVDVKTEVPLNRSSWSWLMLRTYRHPFLRIRVVNYFEGGGWEIMNVTPLAGPFETQANNKLNNVIT
jgi:hypothetical protein